jgi:DnaJ-class molecular chaperone
MIPHFAYRIRYTVFRTLPVIYWPGGQNPDPEAHVRFQEISAACVKPNNVEAFTETFLSYEVLVDPEAREMYDQYGLDGTKEHGGHGMSPEDLFENIFGGGGFTFNPAGPARSKKGEDQREPYEVSLEDLYTGKSVK